MIASNTDFILRPWTEVGGGGGVGIEVLQIKLHSIGLRYMEQHIIMIENFNKIYSLRPRLIVQFPNMASGLSWIFSSVLCNYNGCQPNNQLSPNAIFGNWTVNLGRREYIICIIFCDTKGVNWLNA